MQTPSVGISRLLLLVGAIVFVDTMFFAALTPLLPQYADELGLTKAGAGLLAAAYPLGAFLGGIPSGLTAARVGVKPTVVIGLGALAVTSTAFGFADSAWQLDVARLLQGVSSAFAWTGALAWLVGAAPVERRGTLIGSAFGAAIAGALFGPVIGGIASHAGTGKTFSAVAVLAVVLAAWALVSHAARPEERQPLSALGRAVLDRRIQPWIGFVVLPALGFGTLGVLAPLRLSDLGWGSLAISATWLISAGFEAVISPVLGHVSDRHGRLLPIGAGLAASALVTALLPWPGHAALLAVLVVAAGISFGTFWTPAMSGLSDAAEARGLNYGYAFALVNLAWAPGQATGAALGGAVAKATDDAVPYLSLSAICALTLAALWRSTRSS
jgi:MFS family permease